LNRIETREPKNARLGVLAVLVAFSAACTSLPAERAGATYAATTYYVSAAGNDATGTPKDPAKPYRSPRGAYSDIPADITRGTGDHVIQLMDGTVYGQLTFARVSRV